VSVPTWAEGHCRFQQVPFRRVFVPLNRPVQGGAEIVTAYTNGRVTFRKNVRLDGYHEAVDLSGYRGVQAGDFVVHGLDILRGSIGVSDSTGAISSVCIVCGPRSVADGRYFAYVMRAQALSGLPRAMARGVREGGADFRRWDTLAELPLPLPTVEEQRAIADFLDAETARIDALITKKRRLIELLVERRRQFVSRAVTLGLNSSPVLTRTGSEFAPSVPRGWKLNRLRHVVTAIVDTAHKTAPVVDGGGFLVVRTANVKQGRLSMENARYTDQAGWTEWTERGEPRPGDVMFTREAPAGEACVVPPAQPLCIGQRMVLLRVDESKVSGEWLVHSVYSGAAQQFIELLSKSTTVAHINMSDIPDIPIVTPPLVEQARILDVVRPQVAAQEDLSVALNGQIDLLIEHRQALITAAVTGELAVPGVVA
jgi:type I restriction enzyme S subunit